MAFDSPGVFVNFKTPDGSVSVRAVSTSTAIFIGPTVIGRSITGAGANTVVTPTRVSSLRDYQDAFSTAGARSGVVSLPTANNDITDHMGQALRGFFGNGGLNAYIVSLSTADSGRASGTMRVVDSGGTELFYGLEPLSDGAWANDVSVVLTPSAIGAGFLDMTIELSLVADGGAVSPVTERFFGVAAAEIGNLTSNILTIEALDADPGGPRTVELDVSAPPATPLTPTAAGNLTGGVDSLGSISTELGRVFEALRDIDDVSIIVFPDRVWDANQGDYALAVAHCQIMKDRMVLVQMEDDTTDFQNAGLPQEKFLAAYYPRARVALPLPSGDTLTVTTNATGHVAGVFARTDELSGVYTAPAGTHATLAGVTELTHDVSQAIQARMNPFNVNALRYINGAPTIWGARTRDTGGLYEYIPVMRTGILIADSLRAALERVVFAKNTDQTWKNVRAATEAFLDTLYVAGAFQGATASDAYRVRIGLGETMSQEEINQGILRLNAAVRPARVAEFIEIVIEQIVETG